MTERGSGCRECGKQIDSRGQWSADELVVCTDCWFNELDGEERKKIAREANRNSRALGPDMDQEGERQ